MMQEAFNFDNVSTSKAFVVALGGRYLFSASATWNSGTVKVQALSQDGSTYVDLQGFFGESASVVNAPINSLGANGAIILDLPPGSYQLTIATATAVYASVARVPLC